ncbi:hypothetical protein ACW180_09580 [Limosilactobacillus fermentum]
MIQTLADKTADRATTITPAIVGLLFLICLIIHSSSSYGTYGKEM